MMLPFWIASPVANRTMVVLYLSHLLQISSGWSIGTQPMNTPPLKDGETVGREPMRLDGTIRCGEESEEKYSKLFESQADVRGLRRLAGGFSHTSGSVGGEVAARQQNPWTAEGRAGRLGASYWGRCKVLRRIEKNTKISVQMQAKRGR